MATIAPRWKALTGLVLGGLAWVAPHRPALADDPDAAAAAPQLSDLDLHPDEFSSQHSEASAELIQWARSYSTASAQMVTWSREHPGRSQWFLNWLSADPQRTVGGFMRVMPEWPVVNVIFRPNIDGLDAFVAWGRKHPQALRDLGHGPGTMARVAYALMPELDPRHARPPEVGGR